MDQDDRMLTRSSGGRIPTTRATLVRAAQGADGTDGARDALGQLCLMYWQPVHVLIRAWCGAGRSADLTQGFMADLLVYGVRSYDPLYGGRRRRFRSWLIGAVKKFLTKRRAWPSMAKQDEHKTSSLDALSTGQRCAIEPHTLETPERTFHRSLAARLIEQAWHTTRDWYVARGNVERFDVLERFIPGDELADLEYGPAADALGISVGAVRRAVMDLRIRYRAGLRRHASELVASGAELDDELKFLFGEDSSEEQSDD